MHTVIAYTHTHTHEFLKVSLQTKRAHKRITVITAAGAKDMLGSTDCRGSCMWSALLPRSLLHAASPIHYGVSHEL